MSSAGIPRRRSPILNASLENSLSSPTFDHPLPFSDFSLLNGQMITPSPFLDVHGNTDTNFDFLLDNFQGLSENYETNSMSTWQGNEAVSSFMFNTSDSGGLTIANDTISSLTTADTEITKVNNYARKEQHLIRGSTHTVDIRPKIAFSLIDEFFIHIHCCLPLLNSVKMKEQYEYLRTTETEKLENLSLEAALLLNGIFALSARFSKANIFTPEPPLHRGQRFFLEATRLFEISCKLLDSTSNSLEYMQGVILLTFNSLQSGPTRQAWLLCGICSRLSCELGLHNTDVDLIAGIIDHTQLADTAWGDREERRRAWWVVWDMDTFANGVALTPFTLNIEQANVLLPMSDDAWHGTQRIVAAHLDAKDATPWTKLSDSSCQSFWAWFLAGTTLLRQAFNMVLSQNVTAKELDIFEARADCFAMALPDSFHVEPSSSSFNLEGFEKVNWIVSTLLMLQW